MRTSSLLPMALVLLAAGIFAAGCGSDPSKSKTSADKTTEATVHVHPTEGPHGGDLITLGADQYRAELLHDDATGKVTVHLLDHDAKEPVTIAAQEIVVQLQEGKEFHAHSLQAVTEPGSVGGASQFEVVDAEFCAGLCADDVNGRLRVTIDGEAYPGSIGHSGHAHDHADHDDADHDDADHDDADHDDADHDDADHDDADHDHAEGTATDHDHDDADDGHDHADHDAADDGHDHADDDAADHDHAEGTATDHDHVDGDAGHDHADHDATAHDAADHEH